MKISYNWLKWYIPEAPDAEKLADVFTYHVTEVESLEKKGEGKDADTIFDIKILPNRAHDLLSHHGIAREVASLLNIKYNDPTPYYKIPESVPTKLEIKIETDKCRRYMGAIVRNVKVGPPPEWVAGHLASIGQRSINNAVDGANLTMFDCGQPIHCFDLDKVNGALVVRMAKAGEIMTTLDNKEVKLKSSDMVIADSKNVLAIAGVKGGKIAEVDVNTKNIIIEVANFDPTSVRKTAKSLGILTDASKRFENDLSPELCAGAMTEIRGLFVEYGATDFEKIVDVYPKKQEARMLSFSTDRISKILGVAVSPSEIEGILKRYNIEFKNNSGEFEINVPPMRLDLQIEEDMAEEIGRVMGYDKLKPEIPKIVFTPKQNELYQKIQKCREYLLSQGFNEIMNTSFREEGKISVLASASDKNFLRSNLEDGLLESVALNSSILPLLGIKKFKDLKLFEIGTVWTPKEEIRVIYNVEEAITDKPIDDFYKTIPSDFKPEPRNYNLKTNFRMWSLFPFIARDVAVWLPEGVESVEVMKVIKDNAGDLVVRGPELFDEFKKDGKISYAFKIVFQSYDRTLTDAEVNEVMNNIKVKIEEKGWQVR
jgi:phenylalanyl-tRNA synthetase beta chain